MTHINTWLAEIDAATTRLRKELNAPGGTQAENQKAFNDALGHAIDQSNSVETLLGLYFSSKQAIADHFGMQIYDGITDHTDSEWWYDSSNYIQWIDLEDGEIYGGEMYGKPSLATGYVGFILDNGCGDSNFYIFSDKKLIEGPDDVD